MPRLICVLFVLTAPLLLSAGTDNNVQKELKALQGKWKTVGLEAEGKPFPKEGIPPFTLVIGADGKSTGQMAQEKWNLTITVDPGKNPKTIDNFHETGKQKGKKQYGIYKLEGDKFTVCLTPPGKAESDRPKSFATKDTTNVVFIFERVKENKKP